MFIVRLQNFQTTLSSSGLSPFLSLSFRDSFFFSSRRPHTISKRDWSSDVCSSDLLAISRPRQRLVLWRAGRSLPTAACVSIVCGGGQSHARAVSAPDRGAADRLLPFSWVVAAARSEERRVGRGVVWGGGCGLCGER